MKNLFKITAVVMITFALASNIYASTFSFYGIKSNKLSNNVLAAAMLSDNTSFPFPGSETGGDSSNNSWWDSPVNHPVHCGEAHVSGGDTNAASAAGTVSTTTNSAGQVIVTVTYANNNHTSYTQTIPAHTATMRSCTGPGWAICTSITAIEACR